MSVPAADHSLLEAQKEDPTKAEQVDVNEKSEVQSSSTPSSDDKIEPQEVKSVNPWDPASFPDGGKQAWLTVAGGAACLFVSFGWINCIGIFQDYYQKESLREYSPSTVAWIPSLQVFFMLFCGPFSGVVFDNYGPRYILLTGTILHVFGLMMTSISTKYYQILLSQAVCSAIGASLAFSTAISCIPTWFFAKRGAAFGAVAAGSSLGGVIFPIMVTHLIPQVGFGWTMRICAFMILALLVFANLTVRSRLPPRPRPFSVLAFVRPLKEISFALLDLSIFLFYFGMFIPFTFLVIEATYKGMSQRMANYLVPIMNATSIFGRTIPNIIADKKVGQFNVMIVMSYFTSALILALWIPVNGNAGLIIFAALFGIASGAGIGLTPALVAGLSDVREIGVRQGTTFAIASVAALTGSPIAGQILADSNYQFRNVQIFGGISCFAGACCFVACRYTIAGFKWKKV